MDVYQIFRAPFSEEQLGVVAPIQQYFQGHARDDAAFMREAFLPSARIESMRDGEVTSWTLDVYCERFQGTPAANEKDRVRNIDWVAVHGTAASARISLEHGPMKFVDYFLLLKTEQGWKIASKVFHGEATDVGGSRG